MIIKLLTGMCAKGLDALPGDLIDWRSDPDCRRMIDKGLATEASAAQIKDAAGRIRVYAPPPATAADAWPPRPLAKLRRDDSD